MKNGGEPPATSGSAVSERVSPSPQAMAGMARESLACERAMRVAYLATFFVVFGHQVVPWTTYLAQWLLR